MQKIPRCGMIIIARADFISARKNRKCPKRGEEMKAAVIGSRELIVNDLGKYLPQGVDCIVSGGALGVDSSAARFAKESGIRLLEFLPDYEKWGRRAPIIRNLDIIAAADIVLAFWNGTSKGTEFVINQCLKQSKPIIVYTPDPEGKTCFKILLLDQQLSFE